MGGKVLIVDDNAEDLEKMKSLVESAGHEVVTASDGASALDALNEGGFDGILIDIKMPTLSGYDLLRLMREKVNGKIKLAYVSIVPKDEVDMDGIDGFIQKPFSDGEFLKKVNDCLEGNCEK